MKELPDSGERETFASGMVRDACVGKPRPELISPFALERLAAHYEAGARKYDDRNWEKGSPFSRTTASMFRHVIEWMKGGTSEDHLAAVAWNAFALMHYQEMVRRGVLPADLDDMPRYEPPTSVSIPSIVTPFGVAPDDADIQVWEFYTPPSTGQTFYISGPMRGKPKFNFPWFDDTRDHGLRLGHAIVSPADLDRTVPGFVDPCVDEEGAVAYWEAMTDAQLAEVVRRDLDAIVSLNPETDGIVLGPGWTRSVGAVAEFFTARFRGIRPYRPDFTPMTSIDYGLLFPMVGDVLDYMRSAHGPTR